MHGSGLTVSVYEYAYRAVINTPRRKYLTKTCFRREMKNHNRTARRLLGL